jgi:hypothetical protein
MIPFPWSDPRQERTMMGRLNHDQEQFFYSFRLDEAVPADHPVRRIAAVLDLSWVYSELAPYYARSLHCPVNVGYVPCMDGARGAREESDISAKRSGAAMYAAFECGRCGRWP